MVAPSENRTHNLRVGRRAVRAFVAVAALSALASYATRTSVKLKQ